MQRNFILETLFKTDFLSKKLKHESYNLLLEAFNYLFIRLVSKFKNLG